MTDALKRKAIKTQTHTSTEERPCEDPARKESSAILGKRPQKKSNLLTPDILT